MKKAILPALLILTLSAPMASAYGRKLNSKFDRADINDDNQLTELEFQATQSKKLSVAYSRFRFNKTDTNVDGFISRDEFVISRGGVSGGKPSKIDLFLLADADENDVLDPVEYSNTLKPATAWPKVLKTFAKRDKNNDAEISPREFGIGQGFPFPFG